VWPAFSPVEWVSEAQIKALISCDVYKQYTEKMVDGMGEVEKAAALKKDLLRVRQGWATYTCRARAVYNKENNITTKLPAGKHRVAYGKHRATATKRSAPKHHATATTSATAVKRNAIAIKHAAAVPKAAADAMRLEELEEIEEDEEFDEELDEELEEADEELEVPKAADKVVDKVAADAMRLEELEAANEELETLGVFEQDGMEEEQMDQHYHQLTDEERYTLQTLLDQQRHEQEQKDNAEWDAILAMHDRDTSNDDICGSSFGPPSTPANEQWMGGGEE
jgi:hypothetical protein